jgi:GNAT superfamily N-acetyltransferase
MGYLFFKTTLPDPGLPPGLGGGLTLESWRPTLRRPLPPRLPLVPFGIWCAFHLLGIFATRDFFILLIRHGLRPVHRTCVLPAHWRFPFMAPRDLQVAGLWTHPDWRGRGLGLAALREVPRHLGAPGRTLWYMVHEDNLPSIRLAQKAGLALWGRGGRVDRWGLSALGSYRVGEVLPAGEPRRSGPDGRILKFGGGSDE